MTAQLQERIDELERYLNLIRLIAIRNPSDLFCQQIVAHAEEALQERFSFEGEEAR